MKKIKKILLMVTIATISIGLLIAAGSSSSSEDDNLKSYFDQGMKYLKSEQYSRAIQSFERALNVDSRDADVLNQLAFAQRKSGMVDQAIINYNKALKIRPKFPQAREYLGEAYLQAALRELDELKKYGDKASEEYKDLKEAILNLSQQVK